MPEGKRNTQNKKLQHLIKKQLIKKHTIDGKPLNLVITTKGFAYLQKYSNI